jgi:2-keto-4-pentenoate hydratase/2-oxohepta-3-ene-1,7-dioic acid hydratase in catechol pathway
MKIIRFQVSGQVKYGMIEGDIISGFQNSPFHDFEMPTDSFPLDGTTYKLSEVKLLAPCVPSKYVGIGINYHKTIEIKKIPISEVPIIFLKPSTSVIGPDDEIILPPSPREVFYEGELAFVIGKTAKDVPEDRAKDYILGYTCTNDVSDVSVFKPDSGNPTRVKSRDTFGPIGPWIETAVDGDDLKVEVYVNGELCQSGHTSDLIRGIKEIVSFISSVMTLLPGDIVATGTPPVAGPMNPGDVVEVKIEKIGTLRNSVVDSK